jgi:gamma-glutamylcyclotransferase (GGCT)/AIG2-like uncharacterized protein YtfP
VERFFFYGLLRRGQRGHAQLRLGERMCFLGEDTIAGTVRDLGAYPGVTLGGAGRVAGEVHETGDPDLIARLDAYEGYDAAAPATSEYLRVRATTLGGTEVWIYEHNPAVGARAR